MYIVQFQAAAQFVPMVYSSMFSSLHATFCLQQISQLVTKYFFKMPQSIEEKERKRKQIAKQCQNLGTMLKRLKRTHDSSQSSQIHDDPD